jgi:putative ABC transport system permease protein
VRGAFGFFSLRPLWRKKVRVALSAASVAIGVAAFVATAGTNRSLLAALEQSASAMGGKTDLEVRSPLGWVPLDLVETVREVEGVEVALPFSAFAIRLARPRFEEPVLVVGVDLVGDAALRVYRGSGTVSGLNPLALLTGSGVLLGRPLAEELGLRVGSDFEVSCPAGKRRLLVAGMLEPEGMGKAFASRVMVMPVGLAQSLLSAPDRCGEIHVLVAAGAPKEEVRHRIEAAVGERFLVAPPEGPAMRMESVLGTLRVTFLLTSIIALGVAVFLVYNSATLAAAERAQEFGLLRALGATRRLVLALSVGESALIGAFGALPGVGLGAILSNAATRLFVRDVAGAYFVLPRVEARVAPEHMLAGAAAGILAAAAAALLPAITVSRVSPLFALRREIREDPLRLPGRLRVAGTGLFLAAAILAHLLGPDRLPHAGWIVFAAISAALLLGVWPATRALAAPLGACLRRVAPVSGRLAYDGFVRSPGRIGFTAAAIAAGFALALQTSLVLGSCREAIGNWVVRTLGGDLWIFHGSFTTAFGGGPFGEDVLEEVRRVPGVARAGSARVRLLPIHGEMVMLTAFEPEDHAKRGKFDYRSGDEATTLRELPGRRALLVSEGFARHYHVARGDAVRLPTAKGEVEYRVVGVVVDYSWPMGVVLVDRAVYREDFGDPMLDDCVVALEPGADAQAVRKEILARLGDRYDLFVGTLGEFRDEVLATLDRFFGFMRAEVASTVLLAFLGVVNAVWIGTLVRSRELGLLRAVGAPSRVVFRLVTIEGLLIGVAGGVIGAAVGIAVAGEVLSGLSIEFTGYGIPLRVPPWPVVATAAGSVLASVAAAVLPARAASRSGILEAIAYE